MIILLHSSKTMVPSEEPPSLPLRKPEFIARAKTLNAYLQTLSVDDIAKRMHVSQALAAKTHSLIAAWSDSPGRQSLALDCFRGDIYSGLRTSQLSKSDRDYADKTLRILSGLYGIIRPYDGICPYRLEMAYTFPGSDFKSLYSFWNDTLAASVPSNEVIVNASSVEYSQVITRYVDSARIITPQFLTINPKTGEPTFVVVHAKIARGAFARWLITSRVTDPQLFDAFADLGYEYDPTLSKPQSPVYVCKTFEGIGLSMRLR